MDLINMFENISARYDISEESYFGQKEMNWEFDMACIDNVFLLKAFVPLDLENKNRDELSQRFNDLDHSQTLGTYRIIEDPDHPGLEMRTIVLLEDENSPVDSIAELVTDLKAEFSSSVQLLMGREQ